ncbi:phosphoribosyltransferase family protein [Streptomyces sp. NPDC046925]|uniref:ComF family protein n=1 Tax=Streptomyces sp. NPDC046925 TaxID=3155375 RepID=UPI003405A8DC
MSHLEEIIRRVRGFSAEWTTNALAKTDESKAGDRRRTVVPGLFQASPAVKGKRILLFDDTYTTGSTMGSAAHALKKQGATAVVGLTLGRQLRAEWSNSRDFVASLEARELDTDQCIVHGHGREDPFDFFYQQSG